MCAWVCVPRFVCVVRCLGWAARGGAGRQRHSAVPPPTPALPKHPDARPSARPPGLPHAHTLRPPPQSPHTHAGTLKARARTTLSGAIIASICLFVWLILAGMHDEKAAALERKGGTGGWVGGVGG